MKKLCITFVLATAIVLTSVLPIQIPGSKEWQAGDFSVSMMDCADLEDCDNCDENSAMLDCDKTCPSACPAGLSPAVVGTLGGVDLFLQARAYGVFPDIGMVGARLVKDVPPPRI